MAHHLAIQKEGPEQAVTGDELRFEATGMEGSGWTYTWKVHDPSGKDAGGEFTHGGRKRKVVHYRLPDTPGLYTVHVTAKKTGEGAHTDDLRLPVQPRPLTKV